MGIIECDCTTVADRIAQHVNSKNMFDKQKCVSREVFEQELPLKP